MARHQQSLGAPVYATDDDPEESGYTNPLPTADDDGPDPQEVCNSGEGCWVTFKGAGLGDWCVRQSAAILSIDAGHLGIHRYYTVLHHG